MTVGHLKFCLVDLKICHTFQVWAKLPFLMLTVKRALIPLINNVQIFYTHRGAEIRLRVREVQVIKFYMYLHNVISPYHTTLKVTTTTEICKILAFIYFSVSPSFYKSIMILKPRRIV